MAPRPSPRDCACVSRGGCSPKSWGEPSRLHLNRSNARPDHLWIICGLDAHSEAVPGGSHSLRLERARRTTLRAILPPASRGMPPAALPLDDAAARRRCVVARWMGGAEIPTCSEGRANGPASPTRCGLQPAKRCSAAARGKSHCSPSGPPSDQTEGSVLPAMPQACSVGWGSAAATSVAGVWPIGRYGANGSHSSDAFVAWSSCLRRSGLSAGRAAARMPASSSGNDGGAVDVTHGKSSTSSSIASGGGVVSVSSASRRWVRSTSSWSHWRMSAAREPAEAAAAMM